MTRNIMHRTHNQPSTNARNQRQAELRIDADEMLRDIAFVLKITQRVRDEMDADKEAYEPALA
jgi:hypothetical protein